MNHDYECLHGYISCRWCVPFSKDYDRRPVYRSTYDANAGVKATLRAKINAAANAISIIKEFAPESKDMLTRIEGVKQGLEIALREIK